ncbi:MAG: hypothetical protein ACPG7R_06730, partial [Planctomycetota bacterium]
VAVYLSNDAAITTNDVLLGFHELSPLGVGVGSTRALAMPVPGGIAPGSYRVGLWVDDLNTEPELNEGNNLLVAGGLLDVLERRVVEFLPHHVDVLLLQHLHDLLLVRVVRRVREALASKLNCTTNR